jgi:2-amino-4-hydroxy-6-hydroxymethyldihydropteridine diphosphokinase
MTIVTLALGSNLGDRLGNLRAAVTLLRERGVPAIRFSGVWETDPVPADQPRYLNAVIAAETTLTPIALLAVAKEVEYLLGRRPSRRWGARPADIDILFYGDQRIDEPALQVPHPRIAERAFVLAPLAEVTAGPLPILNRTALDLLAAVGTAGLTRTAHSLLP